MRAIEPWWHTTARLLAIAGSYMLLLIAFAIPQQSHTVNARVIACSVAAVLTSVCTIIRLTGGHGNLFRFFRIAALATNGILLLIAGELWRNSYFKLGMPPPSVFAYLFGTIAAINFAAIVLQNRIDRFDTRLCVRCGYILYGSESLRCPECGWLRDHLDLRETEHDPRMCSNCGFDLRGSDSPRCPECGKPRNGEHETK